jgi:GntR family transcriptional regulator/MocR family aminotransferase
MPLDRRLEILAWARQHSAWLIEDDYDSEYRFEGRPIAALQGLDVAGRVVFTGSFNKLMFPALRIGFIVLPPSLVDAFRAFRFRTELQGSSLDQAVLCDFIVDGHLSRHIRHMREIYGTRLDALDRGVKRYLRGIASLSPVRAGLYTSLLLHNGLGSEQAESVAAAAGVESLGLHRFCIRCQDPKGLLLGFGGFPEPAIHAALRKLARAFESS